METQDKIGIVMLALTGLSLFQSSEIGEKQIALQTKQVHLDEISQHPLLLMEENCIRVPFQIGNAKEMLDCELEIENAGPGSALNIETKWKIQRVFDVDGETIKQLNWDEPVFQILSPANLKPGTSTHITCLPKYLREKSNLGSAEGILVVRCNDSQGRRLQFDFNFKLWVEHANKTSDANYHFHFEHQKPKINPTQDPPPPIKSVFSL